MISIVSKHHSPPGSMLSFQASTEGKTAWFLAVWHPEKDFILEEIQAEIKLEIIKSELTKLSKVEAENWLKGFFSEYHWQLHARLRKSNLIEKGLSVFFALIYGNEIIFVQFGRMLCGVVDRKGLHEQGSAWKHYHIKTAEDLELLGGAERDIRVKTHRLFLEEKQHLMVAPASIACKLRDQIKDHETLQALLESYREEKNAIWLQLSRPIDLSTKRKRKLSRLQISSIVLIFVALVAALYVAFGNRFIDQALHRLKLSYHSKRALTLEELPNTLRLRNADILKIMERVVNAPARNVEFRVSWTKELPFSITAIPVFDLDKIYIASGKNLMAFDKKGQDSIWNLALDEKIASLLVTQHTIVLSLENKRVIGIKPAGTIAWALELSDTYDDATEMDTREITNSEDPRIDGSIIVIPEKTRISVVDGNRGEVFSSIELKQPLRYFSSYDSFDSCFYAVVGNSLMRLDLVVLN